MPASSAENSLANEIWPLITGQTLQTRHMEFGFLLHLLYLKGYSYESLVTRKTQTKEVSAQAALQEMMTRLRSHGLSADERTRKTVAGYLEQTYPSGQVVVQQNGRFGKVLIRLQDQSMYIDHNGVFSTDDESSGAGFSRLCMDESALSRFRAAVGRRLRCCK